MRAESASVWIVPANFGDEIALLIKVPASAIKGLIAGCRLELLLGRHGPYLCAGARIFDVPDAAMLISACQREEEDHQTLRRLLRERTTPAFLFNELDASLAWTNIQISEGDAQRVLKIIEDDPPLRGGQLAGMANSSLA